MENFLNQLLIKLSVNSEYNINDILLYMISKDFINDGIHTNIANKFNLTEEDIESFRYGFRLELLKFFIVNQGLVECLLNKNVARINNDYSKVWNNLSIYFNDLNIELLNSQINDTILVDYYINNNSLESDTIPILLETLTIYCNNPIILKNCPNIVYIFNIVDKINEYQHKILNKNVIVK